MAISRNNVILKNFHGRIGNIVLRVFGNKTVMSCLPTFKNRKWGKAQLECQDQFRKATKFGHKVLADPNWTCFTRTTPKRTRVAGTLQFQISC